jgi:hypothetical protein
VAYGEWLRQQGDPRGALVAADAAAADAGGVVASGCHSCDAVAAWFRRPSRRAHRPPWWPSTDALLALDAAGPHSLRHRSVLARHGRQVVGGAADGEGLLHFGWRLGFIEALHFAHPGDGGYGKGRVGAEGLRLRAALRRALGLPAARFARVVDVELPAEYEGEALFADESFLADALGGRALSSVASFSVGATLGDDSDDPDFPSAEGWRRRAAPVLGAIGRVSRAFPRLEHLSVAGRGVDLRGVDLARLRHASFDLARPEEGALGLVSRADWQRLRSLRLAVGDFARPEHASDVAAEVVALAESGRVPELRHLRLERMPLTDELCDALGHSPAAGALVSLEIVHGEMTAEGAEALLRHRHKLKRLRALVVGHNALSDEALEALAAGFGRSCAVLAGEQFDLYEHDGESDCEFVREEELRARGGRPDPLGGLARDDDGGDDIEGLLDAAVVLSSLRGASERDEDDEADEDDEDGPDAVAEGPSAQAPEGNADAPDALADAEDEGADAWPTNSAPDVDDEGSLAPPRRRRKRARRGLRRVDPGTRPA